MSTENTQRPYTTNQIKQEHNTIPKWTGTITGHFANSMNGGQNKCIYWKRVMPGEAIREFRFSINMQMLTPLSPSFQRLKCKIKAYWVPDSRVFEESDEFYAQGGGATRDKITELPNTGGMQIPLQTTENNGTSSGPDQKFVYMTNTTLWRDSFISSYIPRLKAFEKEKTAMELVSEYMPKINILGLRGRVAIYNDYERNKEYQEEITEYNGVTVSQMEWQSYYPLQSYTGTGLAEKIDYFTMRARRDNSYYTDYRTEYQGFAMALPTGLEGNEALVKWASYEALIQNARTQAENAQKNPWDIIEEQFGAKKLKRARVSLIGEQTFDINYSAITQNTYNTNEEIQEKYRVMGQQGAYSYTSVIKMPIFAGQRFEEAGIIHFIATITADTVFESGLDRYAMLNVQAVDQYNPTLKDDKLDVIYQCEMGTSKSYTQDFTRIYGYKRRWNEYFKMPNLCTGDMSNKNFFQTRFQNLGGGQTDIYANQEEEVETQKTYQFYEEDDEYIIVGEKAIPKKPYLDYTDLQINRNQAIMNEIIPILNDSKTGNVSEMTGNNPIEGYIIGGQNQIFFAGVAEADVELPISADIEDNYSKWGEH